MEKKDLLGVRKRPPAAAAKRRRRVLASTKAGGGGVAGGLAKAIAAYLASDSYMYAPLVSAPLSPPPSPPPAAAVPSATPPTSTPEKKSHWCKNTEALGKLPLLPTRSICGNVVGVVHGAVSF